MKIAFVALPESEDHQTTRVMPPLPLAYMAALLEHQRHIVRIYDLALAPTTITQALAPLRVFRPHLVVITAPEANAVAEQVKSMVDCCGAQVMYLDAALREPSMGQAAAGALWRANERAITQNEQTVIFEAVLALNADLDVLPLPARHLMPLEQYPLFTPAGDLQTSVLLAQYLSAEDMVVRQPIHIVAELQSIAREYGIRHVVFPHCPVQGHLEWLEQLLACFRQAQLDIAWEAVVRHDHLDAALLAQFRGAGCETICFEFTAGEVLGSKQARAALTELIHEAHALGISVRGRIQLEPLFSTVPAVVDMSATFNLDHAEFCVRTPRSVGQTIQAEKATLDDVTNMARSRYRSSRSRHFFVERFGPQIGPMLWRVGRAGLLGRTWWNHAHGSEDTVLGVSAVMKKAL